VKFLKTVRAKYKIIALKLGHFSIPDKIKSNLKIEGDVSNIQKWKAKVILGNSGGKEGEWDDVGYVGFKPSTGTLVPVARADEHQTGYDLIDYYIQKGLIPKGKYTTIWVRTGPNYAHDDEHIKELIPVYKKWLELGGENLRIKTKNKYMSFEDLVNGKDGIEHPQGKLGKRTPPAKA